MASKTSKLFLSGAVTAALAAGCQTQPLGTAPSLGLDAAGQEAFGVLGKKGGEPAPAAPSAAGPCLEQPYAVFARSQSELFHLTGARNRIEGDAHTNDTLKMAGNNDVITGVGEAVDGFFVKGKSNAIGKQATSPVEDYPLAIDPAALGAPTFSFTGDVNLNDRPEVWQSKGVLKTGLYRATGAIILPTNGVTGTVTFVAARIQLPGKSHSLKAYAGGVLGYATGTGNNAIHLAGNGNSYAGLFAAPNGAFQLTGHQNTVSGMVMADTFKMAGSNNTIRFADHGYCQAPSPEPTVKPTATPTPVATVSPTPTPAGTAIPSPAPTDSPPPPTPDPSYPPTTGTPSPAPVPSTTPTPVTHPTMDATWVGQGEDRMDYQAFGANGHADAHVRLEVALPDNTVITQIRMLNGPQAGEWNTVNGANWLLGVYKNGALVNTAGFQRPLGTYSGRQTLDLYGTDGTWGPWFPSGRELKIELHLGNGQIIVDTVTVR